MGEILSCCSESLLFCLLPSSGPVLWSFGRYFLWWYIYINKSIKSLTIFKHRCLGILYWDHFISCPGAGIHLGRNHLRKLSPLPPVPLGYRSRISSLWHHRALRNCYELYFEGISAYKLPVTTDMRLKGPLVTWDERSEEEEDGETDWSTQSDREACGSS